MTAQCDLNKNDTHEYAKVSKGKPMRPQSYTKNCRQLRKGGSRRCGPPREEHTNCLSSAKKAALETYIKITL